MQAFKLNANTAYVLIKTRKGNKYRTFFDLKDAQNVCRYTWHLSSRGYARTQVKTKFLSMPEILFNKKSNYVWRFDHRNRDRIDNRQSNLRFVHCSEDLKNRAGVENKTGVHGVSADRNYYRVRDRISGRHKGFNTIESALICSLASFIDMTGSSFEKALEVYGIEATEDEKELLRCTVFLYALKESIKLHSKCK